MAMIVPAKLVEENKDFGRTINQLIEIFINKEMKKRNINEFRVAIVEIFDDGKLPKVYLNEEAKFRLSFKNKKLDQNSIGQIIRDLREIKEIEWHEGVLDKDSAKFFIIKWNKDYWILDFDFRYNKGTAKTRLERAKEFLECVKYLDVSKTPHPIIYLLWSVCELIIDSELYLLPQQKPKKAHRDRKEKIEKFGSTSNIFSQDFIDIFNKFSEEKNNARYGGEIKMPVDKDFVNNTIKIIERTIQDIQI
ncbi:MAG: hypothetical protein V1699_01130 [Candidatus Omnitrophota bacterium]